MVTGLGIVERRVVKMESCRDTESRTAVQKVADKGLSNQLAAWKVPFQLANRMASLQILRCTKPMIEAIRARDASLRWRSMCRLEANCSLSIGIESCAVLVF